VFVRKGATRSLVVLVADPAPLNQHSFPFPSSADRDVMGVFRALYARQEVSPRALALTEDAIALNPANYSAWHYRRVILRGLQTPSTSPSPSSASSPSVDFRDELAFLERVAGAGASKNYQVWQHRRVLAGWLGEGAGAAELAFSQLHLLDDAKNYHAWSHRQWAVQAFGLWDGAAAGTADGGFRGSELEFTEALLMGLEGEGDAVGSGGADDEDDAARNVVAPTFVGEPDVRNNSAWNHRWFVLTRGGGRRRGGDGGAACPLDDPAVRSREVAFALSALKAASKNEAAWTFLRAVAHFGGPALPPAASAGSGPSLTWQSAWPEVTAAARAMREYASPGTHPFANEWLAEAGGDDDNDAGALFRENADCEPVRRVYWTWRAEQAASAAAAVAAAAAPSSGSSGAGGGGEMEGGA
jgi:hypothetical protein